MVQGGNKSDQGFGLLFEDDYLIRNLGQIAHDPEVALAELVANAWDAGASLVDITIPKALHSSLVVEDDGHGMSSASSKDAGRSFPMIASNTKAKALSFHLSAQVGFAAPSATMGWAATVCCASPTSKGADLARRRGCVIRCQPPPSSHAVQDGQRGAVRTRRPPHKVDREGRAPPPQPRQHPRYPVRALLA